MEKVTTITVDGQSYALSDPTKLPQPAQPVVGALLQVQAVEDGSVTEVSAVPASQIGSVKSVNGAKPDENGNVQVEGAVLYTNQNLTPEQQEQARENIGFKFKIYKFPSGEYAEYSEGVYKPFWSCSHDEQEEMLNWPYFDITPLVYFTGEADLCDVVIARNGALDEYEYDYAREGFWYVGTKADRLGEDLGDIATALDHIIALQEELIGQ